MVAQFSTGILAHFSISIYTLRLAPDEFAALLAPGTGAPDIRSVFRIDTGTGVVRALLDTVEEYDPEAASVRCTFTRLTEDAL